MNNIVDISDNELVMLAVWDDLFRSYLNKRYYYLINVYKYKFMRVIKYYDIDEELIINYGLIIVNNRFYLWYFIYKYFFNSISRS